MINAKSLLDQFMGSGGGGPGQGIGGITGKGGLSGAAGGAAAGGLIALLLGSKSGRKLGGKALTYGGAAAVGALAYRAWQNYQAGRQASVSHSSEPPLEPPQESPFQLQHAPAADGLPFELALVRTMIAAAKADGHVDADEQRKLFEHVDQQGFDNETKAWMFDQLRRDHDVAGLAAAAGTPEQAAELYLAARLAIDPDEPGEEAFLRELAARLDLPDGLREHLDAEVEAQARV